MSCDWQNWSGSVTSNKNVMFFMNEINDSVFREGIIDEFRYSKMAITHSRWMALACRHAKWCSHLEIIIILLKQIFVAT